jgi:hypothetical protein
MGIDGGTALARPGRLIECSQTASCIELLPAIAGRFAALAVT